MVTCARSRGTLPQRLALASVEAMRKRSHVLTVLLIMALTSPWRRKWFERIGASMPLGRGTPRFQNRRKNRGPGVNGTICALLETSETGGKRRQWEGIAEHVGRLLRVRS